ncbi:MAG: aldo/keto reductase [Defluviitaleaceae bacterium]|nr:aldo/keto reductase [Defluviitaleaceae bacterium]
MIYKDYGTTGKKISAIGFGGMRFLEEEYTKDKAIAAQLVHEAFTRGITYFDTAPGYCKDQSEEIMGEAFKTMKYGDFYVSTKCSLWNAKDADDTRRMIEQSLKRLNVPKITFYNLWCIKNMDEYHQMTAKGGIYEGILKAQQEGLVEHITCTTHADSDDIAVIMNEGLMEGVTLGYNAVNFAYRRKGIVASHEAKKGVVVMNPLGGGAIPQNPQRFSFLTEGTTDNVAVAAMKFLVAHKEITAALPGFSTVAEIEDAVAATKNLPVIDEAYLSNLAQKLGEELNALCTSCAYCDECPEGIPVPKLIDSYNEALLSEPKDMANVASKLKNFWGITAESAKKCIECGICERLCTQKLPIIERLREMAAM